MKQLLTIATIAATTLFTAPAFAQAKNFEGFSLAAGFSSVKSGYTGTLGANTSIGSATDTAVAVQGQYAFALGNTFVLAAGAGLVGDVKADAGTGKLQNITQVYIAPGAAVSDTVLVYGKLAAMNYSFSNTNGSFSNSGTGYGVGAQLLLSKNIYIQAEYLNVKPADTTFNGWNIKNDNVSVTNVSIGYKF